MGELRAIVFGLFLLLHCELLVASANLDATYLLRHSHHAADASLNHGFVIIFPGGKLSCLSRNFAKFFVVVGLVTLFCDRIFVVTVGFHSAPIGTGDRYAISYEGPYGIIRLWFGNSSFTLYLSIYGADFAYISF